MRWYSLSKSGATTGGIAACLIWLVFTLLIVTREARIPGTDIFLFKEAGVSLATQGNMTVKNIIRMPPDVVANYTFYPPAYPFLFGTFSKIFGIGIQQSLLFDSLVRAIRTLLLLMLLVMWHKTQPKTYGTATKWLIAGVFLVLSFLSVDADRPEDLASCFGLLGWLSFAYSTSKSYAKMWFSFGAGVFLGLTAATSPSGGFFFALGILLMTLCSAGRVNSARVGSLLLCGATSLIVCVLVTLPLILSATGGFERFSTQAARSTFPYPIPFLQTYHVSDFTNAFVSCLRHYLSVGQNYHFALILLACGWLVANSACPKNVGLSFVRVIALSALLFVPFSIMIWTLQPYYLWFSIIVLALALAATLLYSQGYRRYIAAVCFMFAFFPLSIHEAKNLVHAFARAEGATVSGMREKIVSVVPVGSRVLVTSDEFFTLRGAREVADITFACSYAERFDYLLVSYNTNARITRSVLPSFPNPCRQKEHCFSMVADYLDRKVLTLAGYPTSYFVRGYDAVLYKNTGCVNAPYQ